MGRNRSSEYNPRTTMQPVIMKPTGSRNKVSSSVYGMAHDEGVDLNLNLSPITRGVATKTNRLMNTSSNGGDYSSPYHHSASYQQKGTSVLKSVHFATLTYDDYQNNNGQTQKNSNYRN